jgi:hypothetical protein
MLIFAGYLYAKTILFSMFFLQVGKDASNDLAPSDALDTAAEKCRLSAQAMITIIYQEYQLHHPYQTW